MTATAIFAVNEITSKMTETMCNWDGDGGCLTVNYKATVNSFLEQSHTSLCKLNEVRLFTIRNCYIKHNLSISIIYINLD